MTPGACPDGFTPVATAAHCGDLGTKFTSEAVDILYSACLPLGCSAFMNRTDGKILGTIPLSPHQSNRFPPHSHVRTICAVFFNHGSTDIAIGNCDGTPIVEVLCVRPNPIEAGAAAQDSAFMKELLVLPSTLPCRML